MKYKNRKRKKGWGRMEARTERKEQRRKGRKEGGRKKEENKGYKV